MRLVLDTNVVVSAMLWGGSPKLLLQARREKRAELYTSTPLLAELTDILGRSRFLNYLLTTGISKYKKTHSIIQPADADQHRNRSLRGRPKKCGGSHELAGKADEERSPVVGICQRD